ncbi:MAG: selenocysteine-specific translation elongation factor [Fimbriimonadaceae bacterium]|nr:selenocysteine-specific translation elongation factor [Fimbriimonadaceae bacterium]
MARLIGTAGHVDHGKTTLLKALTGIDADRLPEEKQRGLTIDIGFAYLDLPGYGRVSIVDVPGHERFVTNMLVGALGIDVGLLCVAADEGAMPQTLEHLEILEVLPVERLVVALTRSDLADGELRGLVRQDVEELVGSSRFGTVPVVEVSATTGEGIERLRDVLAEALSGPEAVRSGPWYLPIDRAFAVKGHGTVVTGTLARGTMRVGEAAILEPGHTETRVRGLQCHDEPVSEAEYGRRVAVNLGGVKLENVYRGMAVGEPGALFETTMFDARVRWRREPKHGQRVRVSLGAAEAIGKVFLADAEPDLVQLRLESSVACALDQPLVVRRYSPPDLLGGGRVVVPVATKRRRTEVLVQPKDEQGDAYGVLTIVEGMKIGVETAEVCRLLGKTPQTLGPVFESLLGEGRLVGFAGLWLTPEAYDRCAARLLNALRPLHDLNPTKAYVPRERAVLAAGLMWAGKPLDRIVARLVAEGRVYAQGTGLRHPEFRLRLNARQRELLTRVTELLDEAGVNVPPPPELAKRAGVPPQAVEEILRIGIEANEVLRIEEGVYYTPAGLEALKVRLREMAAGRPFTAADFRDAVGSSRKYAIPLLEYFDSIGFTQRLGDNRVIA